MVVRRILKEESNRSYECSTKSGTNENERHAVSMLEQLDGHRVGVELRQAKRVRVNCGWLAGWLDLDHRGGRLYHKVPGTRYRTSTVVFQKFRPGRMASDRIRFF